MKMFHFAIHYLNDKPRYLQLVLFILGSNKNYTVLSLKCLAKNKYSVRSTGRRIIFKINRTPCRELDYEYYIA